MAGEQRPVQQYYAVGDTPSITRFNPTVTVFPLSGGAAVGSAPWASLVSGALHSDPSRPRRSDLSALDWDPSGHMIVASVEGSGMVAIMPAMPTTANGNETESLTFGGNGEFLSNARLLVEVGEGPRGVALALDGTAAVWTAFDRTVLPLDLRRADREMAALRMPEGPRASRVDVVVSWTEQATASLGPSPLPVEVRLGRRLFSSPADATMTTPGAGVSCATCHVDGRTDGLSWHLEQGPRQTPSLVGGISRTHPVTWTGEVPSAAAEALLTSQVRMGGAGPDVGQTIALMALLDALRDVKRPTVDAEARERGRQIFLRADTECATCHSGERYTDNRSHDIGGTKGVNTPTLVGVGATAPYLRDGRVAALGDLLAIADEIGMGHTEQLKPRELRDVELWLRSL